MTGVPIAEIKASQPMSLWEFLLQLPGSMEAQVLYALLLFGLIGMSGHYTMRWLQGDIRGSLINYMFNQYPRRTILAVSGILGTSLTGITAGAFVNEAGMFVGWLNVLWVGLTTGYAADSVANRGATANSNDDASGEKTLPPRG